MNTKLLIDGCHGIYVPQRFGRNFPQYVDPEQADILEAGPNHELYWDVWDELLSNTVLTDVEGNRYYLRQDSDLFAIQADSDYDDGRSSQAPSYRDEPLPQE